MRDPTHRRIRDASFRISSGPGPTERGDDFVSRNKPFTLTFEPAVDPATERVIRPGIEDSGLDRRRGIVCAGTIA
jgi:hypothetical protein